MQNDQKAAKLTTQFNQNARAPSGLGKLAKSFVTAVTLGFAVMGSAAMADAPAQQVAPATTQAAATSSNYVYDGDRTIRILGAINDATAKDVIEKLYELSEADPNADIELRLNSGGGSVTAGFAIYDVMKSLPNDIRTVCEGNAQSMAAFLLSAGTPGKRFAYPTCQIMYHQPSWGKSGQITDMEIAAAQGNVMKDTMISIIAEDSGWPEDVIRDLLERNFYPTAEEAKEMGFIDHLISPPTPDASATARSQVPDGFCDNPGRRHMRLCNP